MANIDRDIKRTTEQLPSTATTTTISTSSLSTVADSIDTNNNEPAVSPVVIIEEVYEPDQETITTTTTTMEKANGQVVKEVNPTPTPPPTPSPVPSSNGEQQQQQPQQQQPSGDNLKENFKLFAKFGDTRALGETITLSNSDKWFKQAKIIDGKKVTTVDTGIYFKKVAKTKKSLTLAQYNEFLETLAKMKKLEIDELKDKLKTSGPPSTNKTTTAVVGGAIGRLTDHTKYTGTHKERFDATGKGKGKAGREDVVVNSGYVTGFKA